MLYLIYEDETFWLHKRRKPRRSVTNDQGQSYFICSIAFVDFFPAVLLCCVFASPPIDLLITFLISYVKNTLTFFVKLDIILLTLAVRLQMSSGTRVPIYIDR